MTPNEAIGYAVAFFVVVATICGAIVVLAMFYKDFWKDKKWPAPANQTTPAT
jgi:hypothetical protein